ncbi:hypothetical protein [Woeseia oceani]|nr:hypothetical protein [Woeseia oceani]
MAKANDTTPPVESDLDDLNEIVASNLRMLAAQTDDSAARQNAEQMAEQLEAESANSVAASIGLANEAALGNDGSRVAKIQGDLYDALRTVESFDIENQPGAPERLDRIAEMASALSADLNALCDSEHSAQSDLFSVDGGAA